METVTACMVIAAMLVLSAFFSGMQAAFTGSNRLKLEIDRRQNAFFGFAADIFIRNGKLFTTAMLIGGVIALAAYSLAASELFSALTGRGSVLFETLAAAVVFIFIGKFLPMSLALRDPNFYFRTLSFPAYLFYVILYPAAKLTVWFSAGIVRLSGHKSKSEPAETYSRAELADLVEETVEEQAGHEVKLLQNALDFPDLLVRDCMVQRINVESAEITDTIAELTAKFVESQYSRIFIWENSIDNIIGYVNVKSLFRHPKSVGEALMPLEYVPETMPVQELMAQFIKKHASMAVVIDEFGGTAGIVSLEDILEEIFGEIEDEHDTPDLVEKQVGDGEYVLSCQLEVEYLNEKYGLGIEENDEYDTLSGYILFNHRDIPGQGEVITVGKHRIRILKRTSSRVELARVKVL